MPCLDDIYVSDECVHGVPINPWRSRRLGRTFATVKQFPDPRIAISLEGAAQEANPNKQTIKKMKAATELTGNVKQKRQKDS